MADTVLVAYEQELTSAEDHPLVAAKFLGITPSRSAPKAIFPQRMPPGLKVFQ